MAPTDQGQKPLRKKVGAVRVLTAIDLFERGNEADAAIKGSDFRLHLGEFVSGDDLRDLFKDI